MQVPKPCESLSDLIKEHSAPLSHVSMLVSSCSGFLADDRLFFALPPLALAAMAKKPRPPTLASNSPTGVRHAAVQALPAASAVSCACTAACAGCPAAPLLGGSCVPPAPVHKKVAKHRLA